MPRAITSVAIRTRVSPFLKLSNACARSSWLLLPCNALTRILALFNRLVSASALSFAPIYTSTCGHGVWLIRAIYAWALLPLFTRYSVSSIVSTTLFSLWVVIFSGFDKSVSAWLTNSGGSVAENYSDWRSVGRAAVIAWISGQKPMSINRSASSKTNDVHWANSNSPLLMSASRRPGVAMASWGAVDSCCCCSFALAPPVSVTVLILRAVAVGCKDSVTWDASSRVGTMTSACSLFEPWSMLLSKGNPIAYVFPLPVWANASTSLPETIVGMTACWISVGLLNWDGRAATVFVFRVRLTNDINEPSIKREVESNRARNVRESVLFASR